MGDETDTEFGMRETDNLNGGCQEQCMVHDSNLLNAMINDQPGRLPFEVQEKVSGSHRAGSQSITLRRWLRQER